VIESARIDELNDSQVRVLALQMQQAQRAKDEQLDAHRAQFETQRRQPWDR
jgi:hypothetical protein